MDVLSQNAWIINSDIMISMKLNNMLRESSIIIGNHMNSLFIVWPNGYPIVLGKTLSFAFSQEGKMVLLFQT